MTAYDVAEWSDLFVAAAGASAALTGLLFVAVSINIDRILAIEGLPDRALQTLVQLLAVVVISLLALTPGQAIGTLGVELLALSLPLAAFSLILIRRSLRTGSGGTAGGGTRYLVVALGIVPFVLAGASLIAEAGGGLYWVLAGTVLALIGAVLNAWVLLVEILR